MEFRILGPLEAVENGTTLPLGGPRPRAVLALLLLNANRVVPADRVMDELWGDDQPEAGKTVLHGYVSGLRKVLGSDAITTRGPGYVVSVADSDFDLRRFEHSLDVAREETRCGRHEAAATVLREGLGQWRGPALADFQYEPFAQAAIVRLEELRLTALEQRIEADLACGRHAELVGELEALVGQHPLRERLPGQLMLALYRCGRQAEALDAYQRARRALVDELGIEPTHALHELEGAILRQDPALDSGGGAPAASPAPAPAAGAALRAILVVSRTGPPSPGLVGLAEALAARPARELILVSLVAESAGLGSAAAGLQRDRAALLDRGVTARVAAFTSRERAEDVVRLAGEQNVDLLLLDAGDLVGDGLSDDVAKVMTGAPCDVALVVTSNPDSAAPSGQAVLVPFGGAEHEWAAAEIGAWLASAVGAPLRLLGTAEELASGRRDASRLLASASLVIQQVSGVVAEPVIAERGPEAVLAAARDARTLVLGLPDRWRQTGPGASRLELARRSPVTTLLVRGGLRPGGLAPQASMTRYTWTLDASVEPPSPRRR
jgi:DNA-binding SARP family transcriptional activator